MSVSTSLLLAAASAPAVNPTPSTSIALIGTSMRLGPSRSSWPTTMAAATRTPRLHQVRPTTKAKPVAIATPASTASTRSTPLNRVLVAVACTTSSAVSAATSGGGFTRPSASATR
jgi:hypothetical protein